MTSFYGEERQINLLVDEEENRVSRENIDKWIFRLLLLLIGFMPLIVLAHVKEVISPHVTNIGMLTSGVKGDIFTYYKSILILIITITTGILLLSKIFFMNGTIRKTVLNYFLGLFAISIVISTIFSPNISIALTGQYNRTDGAISWLCYIALMFIAMNINYPKNAVNKVLYSLYPFVFINFFIITMNFTGFDLMQNEWVQKIVTAFLPEGASLAENSQLVGTLNQWNYMSGMFAAMTVMFLTASIIEKKLAVSISHLIVSMFSMFVMLMALSTSGFLTVSVLMILVLFIVIKSENKKKSFALILTFLVVVSPVFHVLAEKNPRVWTESFGFVIKSNPYIKETSMEDLNIKSIQLSVSNKVFAADNSFELPVLPESGISAGTGRVYIWEKTLDLVKKRPLFGSGLDTLMYQFPHYNIDARAGIRTEHTIVDKPHNVYMGILYGTGIVGLIGFIGIVLMTLITLVKSYKNQIRDSIVLGIAWIAFLVQALFNDSLPGVTATMFVLAGILMALILINIEK
jgi:O-Antigen ligase